MRRSWDDVERKVEEGPSGTFRVVLVTGLAILVLGVIFGAMSYGLGWFSETAQVAQQEFGPRASRDKYMWFKNSAAALDSKKADIKVLEERMNNMRADYKDVVRLNWPREDREQYNVWVSELAGLKVSFNNLAGEYNSKMAQFNWAYANAGELPKGADVPLPREFKFYVTQ